MSRGKNPLNPRSIGSLPANAQAVDSAKLDGLTKEELFEELGGGWTLLWENAAPTSTFAAQTLSIPGGEQYDLLLIVFHIANNLTCSRIGRVAKDALMLSGFYGSTNAIVTESRVVNQNVGKGVFSLSFTDNSQFITGAGQVTTVVNDRGVPVAIYGAKIRP